MNFSSYYGYFQKIIEKDIDAQVEPYCQQEYFDYTKLNWSRLNRWLKSGELTEDTKQQLQKLKSKQSWLIIAEPWCGDAAHIVPFIELMAKENECITVEYELRDSEPFSIEHYLTNGSKSIPKLIIRNDKGDDVAVWGPRPEKCAKVFAELKEKELPFEDLKIELQKWYNQDKGQEIQKEILDLLAPFTY